MTTAAKEKAEKKEPKEKPEQKEKAEKPSVRDMSKVEQEEMMKDMPAPDGYKGGPVLVEDEKTDEPVKIEKPEEKKEEKTAEPAAKEDFFEKLEREMEKPEGKENLTDFTPREKAYFHRMRRDRKLRQQAESERDQVIFRETKAKQEKAAEPVKDPLDGREDDDFLTVKEAREILKKKEAIKNADDTSTLRSQGTNVKYLQLCEKEARETHADFDTVIELADELITDDSRALSEIGERVKLGENPAIVMYEMIKKHRDFEILLPAAEVRVKARTGKDKPEAKAPVEVEKTPEQKAKEDQAKQAEKALEENANLSKTTAHVSSREGKPAEELSMEEITSMSDIEFSKLPRNVRNKYLKLYGA